MTEKTAGVKLALLTSVKDIDKAIERIHTQGQSLQADIHMVACSVIKHLATHGDIRVLHKLLNAMPEFGRVNALRAWFEAHGPVVFTGNDPAYVKSKGLKLAEAMATPFWKFKPEPEYTPLDIPAMIASLEKKIKADSEKTGRDHKQYLDGLRSLKSAPLNATPSA